MKKYNSRSLWTKVRAINLKIGFIISLTFVLFAFQWHSKPQIRSDKSMFIEDVIDLEVIPRSVQKRKTLPPPPPPKPTIIQNITTEPTLTDWIPDEDEDPVEDEDFDLSEDVFYGLLVEKDDVKNSQIKVPESKEDDFILFPSNMPIFGACHDLLSDTERKACSDKSLMKFIYDKLQYPTIASENRISGRAVAEFIVNKQGKVEQVKVISGLGGGIDEELIRVLELMPDWQPGKQNLRPVNVKMTIPVKFVLE